MDRLVIGIDYFVRAIHRRGNQAGEEQGEILHLEATEAGIRFANEHGLGHLVTMSVTVPSNHWGQYKLGDPFSLTIADPFN